MFVIVVPPPPFVVSGFLSLFLEESLGKNVVSPLRRWFGSGVESNNFFLIVLYRS